MSVKQIEKKINNGKDISMNELACLIMFKHQETEEDINRLARLVTAEFDKVGNRFNDLENRLTHKIEDVHIKLTNKINNVEARLDQKIDAVEDRLTQRIDRVKSIESKIKKLA